MKAYIKAHPVKLIVLILIALLALRFFTWSALNMSGFCWAEKRWLSDEEKTTEVLRVIWGATGIYLDPNQQGLNDPGVTTYTHYDLVPAYRSLDDMRRKNPNCCTIKRSGLSLASDDNSRMNVSIPIKYKNKNNEIKSYTYYDQIRFTNCGAVTSMSSALKW